MFHLPKTVFKGTAVTPKEGNQTKLINTTKDESTKIIGKKNLSFRTL